jgi:hypothetical protein
MRLWHNWRMATKSARLNIRVTRQMKATLVSEAKKEKRSLSAFCDILLTLGLLHHVNDLAKPARPKAEAEQVTV